MGLLKNFYFKFIRTFSIITQYSLKILSWLGVIGCLCVFLLIVLIIMHFSYVNQDFEIIVSDNNDILIRNYSNQVGRIWGVTDFIGFVHKTNSIVPTPLLYISGKIKVAELLGQNIKINYKINNQDKSKNTETTFVNDTNRNTKLTLIPDSILSKYYKITYVSTKSETLILVPIHDVNNDLFIIPEKPSQFFWDFRIDCCIGDAIEPFIDLPIDIHSERKLLLSSQPQDSVNGVLGPASFTIFLSGYEIRRGDSNLANITNNSLILFNSIYSNNLRYEFIPSLFQHKNMKEAFINIRLIQSDPNTKSNNAWLYGNSAIVDKLGTWEYNGKCLIINIYGASGNLKINDKNRDFKLSDVSILKFEGTVEYLGTPKNEVTPIILIRGKAKLIMINNEKSTLSYFEKMPNIFRWILQGIFMALLGMFIAGKSRKKL